MEIEGIVAKLLPEQKGESKRGNSWRKQEFILEIPGQFSKNVCITMWGDKIDEFGLQEGEKIKVSIDIESREYNGRWYTDVKAWNIQKQSIQAPVPDLPPDYQTAPPPTEEPDEPSNNPEDDLPF